MKGKIEITAAADGGFAKLPGVTVETVTVPGDVGRLIREMEKGENDD